MFHYCFDFLKALLCHENEIASQDLGNIEFGRPFHDYIQQVAGSVLKVLVNLIGH